MMAFLSDPQAWISLITLVALEIVLGIDNLIFLAILVARLPKEQQRKARILGLGFALVTRMALLGMLFWITKLTTPLFNTMDLSISGRDIVLIAGGMFLMYKSVLEIHNHITHTQETQEVQNRQAGFFSTIVQIGIIDIVFSLDSVITAVGMAEHIEVMIIAIIIAVLLMMFASEVISRFIDTYPTLKILALAFLLIVGIVLLADGFHFEIPRGYVYFAMFFALGVEVLNILAQRSKLRH
ncbi:TerC family protein [Helicobacter sp.]|uniref:TerC family protein n=1 Tax=Helicobacter sp. TaxID=218 RepID=UPI0025C103A7|nr:TerC family protein [Helicobacter sp.]MBR2494121.1 TerC family protein [Helicobacter sp.]